LWRRASLRQTPFALVTEGGYELTALAACLEASFAVMNGNDAPESSEAVTVATDRGKRAVAAAKQALEPHWTAL
jgi:acetoin utilization deacetylase AcuC-like enzyme